MSSIYKVLVRGSGVTFDDAPVPCGFYVNVFVASVDDALRVVRARLEAKGVSAANAKLAIESHAPVMYAPDVAPGFIVFPE